ncbi:hypothetical protein [Pseudooceanicola algae]|uniref:Uncharacterized protein n=1 Tax=Pseudooceanicola algae TaxID=1537215 RepID=A0A418SDF4_9RHOB|nr:hypothetical protein [Pseudooceanicola algae]QPM92282.1 hypothetical protein PSAL_035460 [Pseudooceanicola algae]
MSQSSRPGTARTIVIVAGALGGLAVSIYNYATPLTGVEGTFGAGLVILACVLLILGAFVIQFSPPGILRGIFRFLVGLGAVLTALAAYFLHEWWLIVAMAITLAGLAFDIAQSRTASSGAIA